MPELGPFEYRTDLETGIVVVKVVEQPTVEDYAMLLDALAVDPAFRHNPRVLKHRRGIPGPPAPTEVRRVVDLFESRPAWRGARVAVLVNDDATYGMMRVAEAFSEGAGITLRAFRDESPALRWLTTGEDASL